MLRGTIAFLFTALICTLSVAANPVELEARIVKDSKCTVVHTGILKSASGQNLSLKNNKLVFGGKGLKVSFSSCQPNFGGYDGKKGRPQGGHLYVPSLKKCISIPNPGGPAPYTVSVAKCETRDDSIQTFFNFVEEHKTIFWIGGTMADGSYHHGKCKDGHYGPKKSSTSGASAKLYCDTTSGVGGFKLV